ncbi:hypothetical protein ACOMHN_032590 [Nucella lapillus]
MGAYLSSPVTKKISCDKSCTEFTYGASSMQGWRINQEDAHNCIPDFDQESQTSMFAVYDGHGGSEVAHYCSEYLPDCIKGTEQYKEGDLGPALIDAFLRFDSSLVQEEVVKQLKQLAGVDENDEEEEDDDPVGRGEAEDLRAEADLPLDVLLAKYKTPQGGAAPVKNLRKKENVQSPAIRSKQNTAQADAGPSSTSDTPGGSCSNGSSLANGVADNENNQNKERELQDSAMSSSSHPDGEGRAGTGQSDASQKAASPSSSSSHKPACAGGSGDCGDVVSSTGCGEGCGRKGDGVRGGKEGPSGSSSSGQASKSSVPSSTSDGVSSSSVDERPSASGSGSSSRRAAGSSSDNAAGSSGIGGSNTGSKSRMADGDMDNDDDSEDEEEEDVWQDIESGEDEEDEDDDAEDSPHEDDPNMDMSNEEPGSDSGCTACVVLLRGQQLVVANSGDSRCVLCRGVTALDLSVDHKPEDEKERQRIEKAGGRVTADGRVNGGLNLSRAIGDHFYKRKEGLSPEKQMITALPDIQTVAVDMADQFFVVACDGIWNSMSSQDCVDFIAERLKDPVKKAKPSIICEELFDHCLAENTYGDGTGCDNMTCVLVVLHPQAGDTGGLPPQDTGDTGGLHPQAGDTGGLHPQAGDTGGLHPQPGDNTGGLHPQAGDNLPPSKRCVGELETPEKNSEKRPRVEEEEEGGQGKAVGGEAEVSGQ